MLGSPKAGVGSCWRDLCDLRQFICFSHLQRGLCPPVVSPWMFWGLLKNCIRRKHQCWMAGKALGLCDKCTLQQLLRQRTGIKAEGGEAQGCARSSRAMWDTVTVTG